MFSSTIYQLPSTYLLCLDLDRTNEALKTTEKDKTISHDIIIIYINYKRNMFLNRHTDERKILKT